jgi:hypothetical protein
MSVINVSIEDRDDGGVRVWSEDLPGLILSGANRTRVLADIEPAVRALMHHAGKSTKGLRIDATFVRPATRDMEASNG